MKAVIHERYGGPELLCLAEEAQPQPGPEDVLVQVIASSINAVDYRTMRADPFIVRFFNGFFKPKRRIHGSDIAGVVAAVGANVTGINVGDRVFGHTSLRGGGFAEYATLPQRAVAAMPERLDFGQSASLVLAGFTALQAVRECAKVAAGDTVLIQGAGGGVGTLLLQIAKAYGAHVTAVCGPGSVDLARSLGADRVIDYTARDFTRENKRYDAIFGVNGYQPLAAYREALKPGGIYVVVGGTNRQIFGALLLGALRFAGSGRRVETLHLDRDQHPDDFQELRALADAGALRPVIDRVVPLDGIADAMGYVERGHVRGKVVVQVAPA